MSIPISQFIQLPSLAQLVKNPPTMQETPVRFLGWEDPLEKGKLPAPVLSGESHGQRSLAGYSPQGGKKSDWTERLSLSPSLTFLVSTTLFFTSVFLFLSKALFQEYIYFLISVLFFFYVFLMFSSSLFMVSLCIFLSSRINFGLWRLFFRCLVTHSNIY